MNASLPIRIGTKMRLLVSIAIIAVSALTDLARADEPKNPIEVWHQECLSSSKVDPAIPQKIREGIFENDPKLKSYLHCFQKKGGFIDDSGDFVRAPLEKALLEGIGEELAKKILENCLVKKATPEETSFEYYKCTYDYKPTIITTTPTATTAKSS